MCRHIYIGGGTERSFGGTERSFCVLFSEFCNVCMTKMTGGTGEERSVLFKGTEKNARNIPLEGAEKNAKIVPFF